MIEDRLLKPFEPKTLAGAELDLYDNGLWRFCSDDPEQDVSTYAYFELGPDFILAKGTRVCIKGLWGWSTMNTMTETKSYSAVISEPMAVKLVFASLYAWYAGDVPVPRFLFVEQVELNSEGHVEFHWGT